MGGLNKFKSLIFISNTVPHLSKEPGAIPPEKAQEFVITTEEGLCPPALLQNEARDEVNSDQKVHKSCEDTIIPIKDDSEKIVNALGTV